MKKSSTQGNSTKVESKLIGTAHQALIQIEEYDGGRKGGIYVDKSGNIYATPGGDGLPVRTTLQDALLFMAKRWSDDEDASFTDGSHDGLSGFLKALSRVVPADMVKLPKGV